MKKGFTLIELLVVVAIIGILAAIVIINVTGARAKATKSQIASNLETAMKAYNACKSFAGDSAVGTTPDGTSGKTGNTAICSGTISDPTEASVASGNWPTIPSGYKYVTAGTGNVVQVQDSSTSTISYTCTVNGCSGSTSW